MDASSERAAHSSRGAELSEFPPPSKLAAIDHVGIAVRRLAAGVELYQRILGTSGGDIEELPHEGVRTVFLTLPEGGAVELLEPTRDDSPVARFLARRGEGFHHVAFRVVDCAAAIRDAERHGIHVVPPAPRPGAHGSRVAFFHPRDTGGVLIEVCER